MGLRTHWSGLGRLVLVLGLLLPLGARAADCEFSVRYQSNDPPYTTTDASGGVVGLSADLMREALRRMGCTAQFLEMPWSRALVSLEEGTVDAVPNANRTVERETFALFSAEFTRSANALFIRAADRSRWKIRTLNDLLGSSFRLGVELDAVYSEEYGRLLTDPRFRQLLVPVSRTDALWRMLETGHIDGLIAGRRTGWLAIRQAGLEDEIGEVGEIVIEDPDYVAFSRLRVSQEQVALFDAALAAMRRDGTYASILRRYDAP